MKVKEVVLTAAGLLGMKKEMEEYLSSTASSAKKKVDEFVDCFNLVENELALDYVPLRTKETFLAQDGVVEFRYFTREPARVLSVTDEMDRRVEYALFPTDIRLPAGVKTAKVAYAFLPKKKTIDGESDYQSRVSVGLMAYGVAAEYCAAQGLYAEAAFWNKKYKECIPRVHEAQRGGKIPSRKWV
jgi:hypothetical protein